jgi:iron complex transport system substrate-binding protein
VGLVNIAPKNEQRYPALSFSEIEELNADLILLSSEPYAFKSKDSKVFSPIVNKVMQVDGEFFTWYGSRIILSLSYLKTKPFSIK